MRSFLELQQVRPGYDASDVLTFQVYLPQGRYGTGPARLQFYRGLEERLQSCRA